MDYFKNIIGYQDIKNELNIIVDMVNNTEKYEKIGAKWVRGILLYGNPGTGKTTFVKDFINACNIKSYIIRKDQANGDFMKYIKKVFAEAKGNAPSIILLDDLDKFASSDNQFPEEYTVVQACIDKVKDDKVLVIATVNEFRKLPSSLVRTGRFDKQIEFYNPKGKDSADIVAHYLSNKKCNGLNPKEVSRLLNGGSCAELESILNEASIYAAYNGKKSIQREDIIKAALNTIYNAPENDNCSKEHLPNVAYHEAGHAVVSELLENDSVTLVSIAQRNSVVGGFTSYNQNEEYFYSIELMENRVISLLAGKAANEIVFGINDVGCSNDIERAVRIVERFINRFCKYGFVQHTSDHFADSENGLESIRIHVSFELEKYYQKAKRLLIENREFLDKVANALLEKQTITFVDIQEIKDSIYSNVSLKTPQNINHFQDVSVA